ncbi:PilN domain-containing protein [Nocardioides mangrovi]|uniref:PilN domain-containing protein n=1 Tax=Nocardioides mangrovi TaxID=2874580 RepID=A0ABS7UIE6_9ACTN|nr:PilN domain-containing protein [Nocardioides mangrovi]MBZ5740029.1 PilN domain-containing protein [Nocardioides mangrovi]MBZ5740800.1 PilN domain-containing protein [Nocardioides mangrovi]
MSRTAPEPTASVNLLSPWVFEKLRVHRVRHRFVVGGIALVTSLALVWCGLRFELHGAHVELGGEQAVAAGLDTQLAELSPVQTYVAAVEDRADTVASVTWSDVAFSSVLDALRAATPPGATVTTISVELAAAEPQPGSPSSSPGSAGSAGSAGAKRSDPARGLVGTCPGPDPFGTTVVVGCLTIEGTATSREVVGQLVIGLGASSLFVEPFVDTTTAGEDEAVSFSGSVGLSTDAFSGRFDDLTAQLRKETRR